jgi:hypothetical protein
MEKEIMIITLSIFLLIITGVLIFCVKELVNVSKMKSPVDYRFHIIRTSPFSEICGKDKKSVVFGEKIEPTDNVVLERYCSKTGKWIVLTPDEIKRMMVKEEYID